MTQQTAQFKPTPTTYMIDDVVKRIASLEGLQISELEVMVDSPFDYKDMDKLFRTFLNDDELEKYGNDLFEVKDVENEGYNTLHVMDQNGTSSIYPTQALRKITPKQNNEVGHFYVSYMEVMDTSDFGEYSRHFLIAKKGATNNIIKYCLDVVKKYNDKDLQSYITVVGHDSHDTRKYKINNTVRWSDLFLPERQKQILKNDVEFWINNKKVFEKYNLPHKRSYFLMGDPGNGKSMFIKLLATEYPELTFFAFDFDANVVSSSGDTLSERLFALPAKARKHEPAVIVFEDLDRYFAHANEKPTSLSPILQVLDGVIDISGVMFISTANHPELLDEALSTRKGRFDIQMKFNKPNAQQRKDFLIALFHKSNHTIGEELMGNIIKVTEGTSYAFLKGIYERCIFSSLQASSAIQITDEIVKQVVYDEKEYIERLNKSNRGIASALDHFAIDYGEQEDNRDRVY